MILQIPLRIGVFNWCQDCFSNSFAAKNMDHEKSVENWGCIFLCTDHTWSLLICLLSRGPLDGFDHFVDHWMSFSGFSLLVEASPTSPFVADTKPWLNPFAYWWNNRCIESNWLLLSFSMLPLIMQYNILYTILVLYYTI